jgi:hypothetical protein
VEEEEICSNCRLFFICLQARIEGRLTVKINRVLVAWITCNSTCFSLRFRFRAEMKVHDRKDSSLSISSQCIASNDAVKKHASKKKKKTQRDIKNVLSKQKAINSLILIVVFFSFLQ